MQVNTSSFEIPNASFAILNISVYIYSAQPVSICVCVCVCVFYVQQKLKVVLTNRDVSFKHSRDKDTVFCYSNAVFKTVIIPRCRI